MTFTPWPRAATISAYSSSAEWKEHGCLSSGEVGFRFQRCCFLPNNLGSQPCCTKAQRLSFVNMSSKKGRKTDMLG